MILLTIFRIIAVNKLLTYVTNIDPLTSIRGVDSTIIYLSLCSLL